MEVIGWVVGWLGGWRWWPLHADTIKIETRQQCKLANKQANTSQTAKHSNGNEQIMKWIKFAETLSFRTESQIRN